MDHSPRFLELVEAVRKRVPEIPIEEVRRRLKTETRPILIDVREDHEWEKGRIPGAKHMGRGILERDIEAAFPDPETELVLYCGGGYRSALAADNLRLMGYKKALSMRGGFRGWVETGGPVEKQP